jgi:hypothetical protein
MLLQFGEKNPGMTRVMVGDALVFENERLQQRMNQFFDKIEATLRQCLRDAAQNRRRLGHARRVHAQVSASCSQPSWSGVCSALPARASGASPIRAPGSQPGPDAVRPSGLRSMAPARFSFLAIFCTQPGGVHRPP